jgi:hypothetical protein
MRKSSQEDKMWSFCYIDNTDLHLSLLFQPNISKVNGCSTELTESIEIMGLKKQPTKSNICYKFLSNIQIWYVKPLYKERTQKTATKGEKICKH